MFFRNIIGQKEVKNQLIQSVKEGFIPHARLISGIQGCGSLPLAVAYARYLLCTGKKEEDACGTCPSCVKFNKLAHPDLHFVFPIVKSEKKKKTVCDDYLNEWRNFFLGNPYFSFFQWLNFIEAGNSQGSIYTNESDEIIKKLNLKSYEGNYKLMIIWLPEKMHESCANKLLKMIEEPPEKTVFLLVSENTDLIISTIQSRTLPLHLHPIAENDIKDALKEQFELNEEELNYVAHLSGGNYLKAIETIESTDEIKLFLDLFVTMMRNSWKKDVSNMKMKADFFASLGRERQKAFLGYCQQQFRENFIGNLHIPEINYMNKAESQFSIKFAPYVNERNIIGFMDELALAERQVEQNVNPRLIFFDLSMIIAVLLKK